MAIGTVTMVESGVMGDMKYAVGSFVGSASYTTGGDTLSPSALSNNFMTSGILCCLIGGGSLGNRIVAPLKQTDGTFKLKLYTALTPTELGSATNDSTNTYNYFILGR